MAKQTFTTGQVLTAAQVNALQTNDFNQTVSAKTASYVLVAADKGTRIEFSTSGSVTCTVNTGLFDAGDTVYIQNTGAGVVTITAGTATVNTSATLAVNQYEGGVLYFVSASSAIWFEYASTATGDITGITTGATSGLTGGVTSGTADLKLNTAAKGDLLVGTGSGTVSALSVGANGTTLVADSTQSTGLKWGTAGKIVQVVNATNGTQTIVGTSTFGDSNLSASITPTSSSNKILVFFSQNGCGKYNSNTTLQLRLVRNSTVILNVEAAGGNTSSTASNNFGSISACYLDSPATTSSVTYKTQINSSANVGSAYVNDATSPGSNSTITLMEVTP